MELTADDIEILRRAADAARIDRVERRVAEFNLGKLVTTIVHLTSGGTVTLKYVDLEV